MKEFRDSKGRSWCIKITLGTVKNVEDALGVDLLNPIDTKDGGNSYLSLRLVKEDLLLGKVVAELIKPELVSKGVTTDDFLDSINGEAVKALSNAFFEEYSNFFTARGKEFVATIVNADRSELQKVGKKAEADLHELLGDASAEPLDARG